MKTVEERVRAGAALLDKRRPGWRAKIDVATLDIISTQHCVLGQVYGGFDAGVATLGLDGNARAYGFTAAAITSQPYAILTRAWKRFLSPSAK